MKIKQTIAAALTTAALALQPALADKEEVAKPEQAKVQIAILLDTSSSMSGLIEQTKTQLWKIINTQGVILLAYARLVLGKFLSLFLISVFY